VLEIIQVAPGSKFAVYICAFVCFLIVATKKEHCDALNRVQGFRPLVGIEVAGSDSIGHCDESHTTDSGQVNLPCKTSPFY
jgi:hypothetical protein